MQNKKGRSRNTRADNNSSSSPSTQEDAAYMGKTIPKHEPSLADSAVASATLKTEQRLSENATPVSRGESVSNPLKEIENQQTHLHEANEDQGLLGNDMLPRYIAKDQPTPKHMYTEPYSEPLVFGNTSFPMTDDPWNRSKVNGSTMGSCDFAVAAADLAMSDWVLNSDPQDSGDEQGEDEI